jgi:DNA-directed RNA polymerase subunit L
MDIKIISKTDTEVEIQVKGEGHTLMNALKASLLEDKSVKIATYDIEFPGLSDPILFVRTDKKEDPIDAVKKATDRLSSECESFVKLFSEKAKA